MFNSKNFGSLHSPYYVKDIIFIRVTKPNSNYSEKMAEKMVPGPNLSLSPFFWILIIFVFIWFVFVGA